MQEECWHFSGRHDSHGYGQIYAGRVNGIKKYVIAHRVMYEHVKGPIPEGLFIDHLCENKNCINPNHLEAVTNQLNILRARRKRTHCNSGHELVGDNIRWAKNTKDISRYNPTGISRRCRTCKRIADRKYNDNRLVCYRS